MSEFEENTKKYLQLGAIDKEFVLKFRQQAAKRKFKQIDILRQLISWWNSLDVEKQRSFYFDDNFVQKDEPTISESIETIKHYVRYKIPSAEEQREIESLRQALSAETKRKRKRG